MVGAEVCRRAKARGEQVRALVRETSSSDKVAALREAGVELCVGDLKDPQSLMAACRGVDAVISTASSTLSRQAGDSIESVDALGQLNLVAAARNANADRFVFVSYRKRPETSCPLSDAKAQVESAIQDMNFTVIQASWFREVWLSPVMGFDYTKAEARIYGPGTSPISWVSYRDVAEICAIAVRHPAAERANIEIGGPEALTPLEVVERFERIGGSTFRVEHVPEAALRAQFEAAADPMQKSFAALMLGCLWGDPMDMAPVVETYGIKLSGIDEYVRGVLGKGTSA
jgi:uncharacterized protein YbjT (DUF2867 family)